MAYSSDIAEAVARNAEAIQRERERNARPGSRVVVRTQGCKARVEVDGRDFSAGVRAVRMCTEAGELPRVVLELAMVTDLDVDLETPVIRMPARTAQLLVALGWTPPDSGIAPVVA